MSEQQIINDYLEGRIGQWALYRRLVKIGISVSTALTLTVGLPGVLRGQETLDGLASKSKQSRTDDVAELDRLLRMVGHALTHAVETGNLNALAVGVAKLGVNVDAPLNEPVPLNLDGSAGGVPIALSGRLTNLGQDGDVRLMQLSEEEHIMRISCVVSLSVVAVVLSAAPSFAQAGSCGKNMVRVGPLCVDQYEAIVLPFRPGLLVGDPEGKQFGRFTDDYPCDDNGNDCSKEKLGTKIFAASWPGVTPSRFITWFQAQQACANVGKRLLRNGEWQMAAAGTPDGSRREPACNISSPSIAKTGSHEACASNFGAFDMVGNVWEWVEDWIQPPNIAINAVDTSNPEYGSDLILSIDEALSQGGGAGFPPALTRGGSHFDGSGAGVFALAASHAPSDSLATFGFRCAREFRTFPPASAGRTP